MKKIGKWTIAVVASCIFITFAGGTVFSASVQTSESEMPKISIHSCQIEPIEEVIFDGTCKMPKVIVFDGEKQLAEGIDYETAYGENLQAGQGSVLISGIGTYEDDREIQFTIEKARVPIKGSNTISGGNPKLTWPAVQGAVKYKIYRSAKKTSGYQWLTTTSKLNFTDLKVNQGKTCYYKIKAVDQWGKTKNFYESSAVKLTHKLSQPVLRSGNIAESGKPKLSWDKVNGADQYMLYFATEKNGTYRHLKTLKSTTHIHQKAVSGKKYYYKVKAIDTDNRNADSALSTYRLRSCDLKRPVVKLDLNGKAKPVLNWNSIAGAEQYKVYRSTKKNGTYAFIGKTSKVKYTDQKAKGGKTYYYRVKGIDHDNSGANSAKSISKSVYAVNLNRKLLALTFDDGPGPYTQQIVNVLKQHNSRATFYVLGQRVKAYPDELKAIYQGGNEIGNHSYSHLILSYETAAVIKSQLGKTDTAIHNLIGVKPVTMRPPGGGVNSTVKKNVGKPLIMWNIDTRDWEHRDTDTTVACVLREAADGDIVLMHDIHYPTMKAAVELIPKLKKKGFELVTVSELAKFKGKKMKNGQVYYSF